MYCKRSERMIRHFRLGWKSFGCWNLAALCLIPHSTREERYTFSARYRHKLLIRDASGTKEIDSFAICNNDGSSFNRDAIGSWKVVEVGVRDEDVIRFVHVVNSQISRQYGGPVEPRIQKDSNPAGSKAKCCRTY